MAVAFAFVVSFLVALVLYFFGRQSRRLRDQLEVLVTACTIFGAVSGVLFYLWDHRPSPTPQPASVGTTTTLRNNSSIVTGSGTTTQVVSGGVASPAINGNVGSMNIKVDESAVRKKEGEKK
jgi:hypothetical protein